MIHLESKIPFNIQIKYLKNIVSNFLVQLLFRKRKKKIGAVKKKPFWHNVILDMGGSNLTKDEKIHLYFYYTNTLCMLSLNFWFFQNVILE